MLRSPIREYEDEVNLLVNGSEIDVREHEQKTQ